MTSTPPCIRRLIRQLCRVLLALVLPAASGAGAAATYQWDASWGWLPDDLVPGMALANSFPTNPPVLVGGALRISTPIDPGGMSYTCTGTNFSAPAALVIEAELRVLTNSASVPWRAGAVVGFTLATNIGNLLFISADEIFISNGNSTHGPTAAVDTQSAFHTYRIEVDGTALNSPVRVYQDGILRITGALYQDAADLGSPRITFGEGSSFAHGTSDWKRLSHNAAARLSSVRPVLTLARPMTLGLRGLPGRAYEIQSTTNLASPVWLPRTNLALTTVSLESLALLPPFLPAEFFRARELP